MWTDVRVAGDAVVRNAVGRGRARARRRPGPSRRDRARRRYDCDRASRPRPAPAADKACLLRSCNGITSRITPHGRDAEGEGRMGFYEESYSCIGQWLLKPGKKVILRSSQSGVCRFCSLTAPNVTFKDEAHAIPE